MTTNTPDVEVNKLSLHDAAKANRETGLLLATKEQLVTAIQDRRLHRAHLRVLACVAGFMNNSSGKAWPGRAGIAALLCISPKAVSNLLLELREFGYLIAERERVKEADNRSLMVYTWGKIDHATIRREIEAYVQGVRDGKIPARHHSDESPAPTGQSPQDGTLKSPQDGTLGLEVPPGRVRKSRQDGDSNSYKGTQKKVSAEAPKVATLKAVVWDQALAWLVSVYGPDAKDKLRARLGKLYADHGPGLLLNALAQAQLQGAIEPLDYVTSILTKAKPAARPLRRY